MPEQIDYAALAAQHGAITAPTVDYATLAAQHGAIGNQTQNSPKIKQWSDMTPQEQAQLASVRRGVAASNFNRAAIQPDQIQLGQGPAQGVAASLPQQLKDAVMNPAPGTEQMGAATMPFVSAASPGGVATAGMSLADALKSAIPSASKAGSAIGAITKTHGKLPINTGAADKVAGEIETLAKTFGQGSMPPVVQKYINYQTDLGRPMTFEEGRQFAKSASKLSIKQMNALTGELKAKVKEFAGVLATANREALPQDVQPLFDAAMKEYGQAKNLQAAAKIAKDFGQSAAMKWLIGGAAAGAAYKMTR